jgi:PIN domain nuclease of toxin-antitoxin system
MIAGLLDTSVILCILNNERSADAANKLLASCAMSLVNLAEVITTLSDWGKSGDQIRTQLKPLALQRTEYTEPDALETGALRPLTRAQGLSLGDRACLATAKRLGVPAYACDRQWAKLDPKALDIDIRVIR